MTDYRLTRREYFGVLAAAAVFPPLRASAAAVAAPAPATAGKPMRGAFMILTPFTGRARSTGTTSPRCAICRQSGAHGSLPQGRAASPTHQRGRMRGSRCAKANQGPRRAVSACGQEPPRCWNTRGGRRALPLDDAMPQGRAVGDDYREYFRALGQRRRARVRADERGVRPGAAVEMSSSRREFPHVAYARRNRAARRADEAELRQRRSSRACSAPRSRTAGSTRCASVSTAS